MATHRGLEAALSPSLLRRAFTQGLWRRVFLYKNRPELNSTPCYWVLLVTFKDVRSRGSHQSNDMISAKGTRREILAMLLMKQWEMQHIAMYLLKPSKMNCIISQSLVLSVIEAFQSTTGKIIGCFHNGRSLTNAQSFIRHHCRRRREL